MIGIYGQIYASPNQDLLNVDKAFQLSATQDNQELNVHWEIANKKMLYMNSISITQDDEEISYVLPDPLLYQEGDDIFTYYANNLDLTIDSPTLNNNKPITIKYQGCDKTGYCYQPQIKYLKIDQDSAVITSTNPANSTSPLKMLFIFLILGVITAATPCIWPMLPILAAIILHNKQDSKISRYHTLWRSLSYTCGIGLGYAMTGMLVNKLNINLQSNAQTKFILIPTIAIIVSMVLWQLEIIKFNVSSNLYQNIKSKIHNLKPNNNSQTFALGIASVLIVSPCATPSFFAALTYSTQAPNAYLASLMLFIFGLGLSIPLILVTVGASEILPNSGPWMLTIRNLIGIALLSLAFDLSMRLIPMSLHPWCWTVWAIATILILWKREPLLTTRTNRIIIIIVALVFIGNEIKGSLSHPHYSYPILANVQMLDNVLAKNTKNAKPTLVYFTADWCHSCETIKKRILPQPEVQLFLQKINFYLVDITPKDISSKFGSSHYHIIAPPTWILFDANGKESKRITGVIQPQKVFKQMAKKKS